MEKQQNNSEQIGALQTELQQLTERLEKVQIESQDKSDVSHINKNFMIFVSSKKKIVYAPAIAAVTLS